MKKSLLKFSTLFGLFSLCGFLCSSFLFTKKDVKKVNADVTQDLLIDRYARGNVGYRVTSQTDSSYSVWGGSCVDFRWYYNGLNGYYISYSQPFYTNDEYDIINKGIYYDSSWYSCTRNTIGDKRYLGGFYIDYNLVNDANILFNPILLTTSGSGNGFEYLNGGYYTDNLDTFGTHNGEGIYWETPFKYVYCYLTKLNYLGMSGNYAIYHMEYTYTMSREDGSVYVFTDAFNFFGLKVDVRFWNYQEYNLDGDIVYRNPYGVPIANYGNYDKISFTGSILLWSHEFNLTDLPPSYSDGYNTGYEDGYDDGYQVGYDEAIELNEQAYDNGFNAGVSSVENQLDTYYQNGYSAGYQSAITSNQTIATIFSNILLIGMLPVDFFLRILNFEVLGINVASFITALLSVALTIIVIRLVTGKKND